MLFIKLFLYFLILYLYLCYVIPIRELPPDLAAYKEANQDFSFRPTKIYNHNFTTYILKHQRKLQMYLNLTKHSKLWQNTLFTTPPDFSSWIQGLTNQVLDHVLAPDTYLARPRTNKLPAHCKNANFQNFISLLVC